MRLNRLDLTRYGRFQDADIIFPQPSEGRPDVTVVFGQNEAGKSTAFNGFLELLFGFKSGKHSYDFRFDRSDLLVGAELDLPGRGVMVLSRNSKRAQSLLDAEGRPINEAILSGALHGLTRDQYEDRFSLNEKGLRGGGERIAKAEGDLGQLLHAGLSGFTGMAQTLDSLAERADKFHKKGGRGTALKIGLDRLKVIRKELQANCLTSEREHTLRDSRDQTLATFNTASEELLQANIRKAASRAAEVWYEQTEKIEQLKKNLSNFPNGPDLPSDAAAHVAGLVEKITAQTNRIMEAEEEIAKQVEIINDRPTDKLVLPITAELERLDQLIIDGTPLMERANTARADLERRNIDRDELIILIDEVLELLEVPSAPASTLVLEVNDLEEIATAVQECLTASLKADAARKAVEVARTQQDEAPTEPQDLTALRTAYDVWKAIGDVSALESSQVQAEARLNKVAAGLPKSWRDLIAAGLPAPETLDEVSQEWTTLNANLASAIGDLNIRASELTELRTDLSTHEEAPGTVDIVKTEETRRQRDILWQQHRGDLATQTADQFEKAMYADDSARTYYQTGSEARQRLLALKGQVNSAEARHKTAKTHHDGLIAQRDSLSEQCSQLAIALGFATGTTPSAFSARHQALKAVAEADADLYNAEAAVKVCFVRQEAARDGLTGAALPLGLDPAKGDLPNQVQRALTLEETDRNAWVKWQDGEKIIFDLDSESNQCRIDLEKAQLKLVQLTAALPLGSRSFKAIQAALPHLRHMKQLYDKHQDLSDQIEVLKQAIAALTDSAARLAQIMGEAEDEAAVDSIQIIDRARTHVTLASQADKERAVAVLRRDELEKSKRRAENDRQDASNDLDACFKEQGRQDLTPGERVAKLVERDRLRSEQSTAESGRQKARDGVDADLFIEELSRMPNVTRAAELEQALQDAQTTRDTARDVQREAERLYREAFEAADRADLATERATLLEELRNGAREAAVARLGVLAARGALRQLAAERRSSMLSDVENAFVTMTAPAWTGVNAWTQAEGEKLVGIQADGSAVPVGDMSTGTMGQLYFALRLAGYRSFAQEPGPLPMVLDDIMETFDDTRARAALTLCAEIGVNGQAILFTHHAHLVELATATIDGVSVVDMPT